MRLLMKVVLWFKIHELAVSSDVSDELMTKNPDSSIFLPQNSKNIHPLASSSDKPRSAKKGHVGASKKSELPSLPWNSASWADIRDKKLGMVDKTSYLLKLLKMQGKQFFIVRPRRFGKTVFVEMLEDFFSGCKRRFTGLEIGKVGNMKYMRNIPKNSNKSKWEEFPVIHINFYNTIPFDSLKEFEINYKDLLHTVVEKYRIAYEPRQNNLDLGYLIRKLRLKFNGLPAVVLVDEYDTPVEHAIRTVKNDTLASQIIEYLDQVFGKIKNNRNAIGFAFVTGICKLPLQSMASGSEGAFEDLTYDSEMATAFGFTIHEINTQLSPYLDRFAKNVSNSISLEAIKKTRGNIVKELIKWYDGYHFNEEDPNARVLNTVSTCRSLDKYNFTDHWGQTGNVKMIVKTFYESKRQWRFPDFKRPKGHTMSLSDIPRNENLIDISEPSLPVLMLLYGYLTPMMCDIKENKVTLVYPNLEVEHHLENALAKYVPQRKEPQHKYFKQFFQAMDVGNVAEAVEILRNFEFIIYSHPSKKNVTPDELTRRLNSLFHLCGIIFQEGVTFVKDTSKKDHGGDIDFLTLNLNVNYAISVKCTSHTIGNAMGAIGQLIEYLEGANSNPRSFKQALKKVNMKTEEIYLFGFGFTYTNGGTLDNWIFLPYRDDKIKYAEVHASSEQLKEDFLKTYAHMTSATSNLHKQYI